MYPITFRKERAVHFLDCLINGQAVEHDPGQNGWTVDEMLQLAGACFLTAAVHGPLRQPTSDQIQDWKAEHAEHREAEIETMMHDLHAALEFIAQLTQMAYDGEYDGMYGPIVRCGLQAVDTYVEASVVPMEGFKGG